MQWWSLGRFLHASGPTSCLLDAWCWMSWAVLGLMPRLSWRFQRRNQGKCLPLSLCKTHSIVCLDCAFLGEDTLVKFAHLLSFFHMHCRRHKTCSNANMFKERWVKTPARIYSSWCIVRSSDREVPHRSYHTDRAGFVHLDLCGESDNACPLCASNCGKGCCRGGWVAWVLIRYNFKFWTCLEITWINDLEFQTSNWSLFFSSFRFLGILRWSSLPWWMMLLCSRWQVTMHLHRPYRRFLPCRRFSWPPSCNLDIWIDSDRWIKFQEFQYRKTTQALCRFTGTIAQRGFPQHSHSGLVRVYQSTHFYKNAGFKSVQLEQIPFLPFQRQLGFLRYGFIGTAQTMALYLSDAIHSDPSSDPVERQKYRMAVTYLQLPDLEVARSWSFGNINFTKLIELWLCRSTVSYLWCVQVTGQKVAVHIGSCWLGFFVGMIVFFICRKVRVEVSIQHIE